MYILAAFAIAAMLETQASERSKRARPKTKPKRDQIARIKAPEEIGNVVEEEGAMQMQITRLKLEYLQTKVTNQRLKQELLSRKLQNVERSMDTANPLQAGSRLEIPDKWGPARGTVGAPRSQVGLPEPFASPLSTSGALPGTVCTTSSI